MQFRILGGLGVDVAGMPVDLGGPKQRAVLAALLATPGRPVAADRLADLVWGDRPPANPETSLQAYVSNLRRALEPERKPRDPARVLVTQAAGYALLVDRCAVDASRFEDLVTEGQAALRRHDHGAAADVLDSALAAWAGPPLPELADHPWVTELTSYLEGLRAEAVEARIEAGLALGEHATLVPAIERAVLEEPFRERRRAQLALALYRSGRQREALAALADARTALAEHVGVEPGPDLRRLEADILAHAPSLDVPASGRDSAGAAPSAVPTPGARPVPGPPRRRRTDRTASDSGSATVRPFVGRDHDLDLLLDAAASAANGAGRPVVISGEPGIGKTRLVEELVARLPDAVVAWGRCPESAASAAYWPCIQIGRQLEGADALDGDLIASLLPADLAVTLGDDPSADRLSLHVSVASVLATAQRLLVLVVDDLQWADPSSLRVIEYVAGELSRTQVLFVATVRPTGADAGPALVDCLAELARQPGAVRLDLSGLGSGDVQRWLAARTDGPADAEVARMVHDRSGGNPFFVGEVVELLASEGRLHDRSAARVGTVPAAVQDVVRRRVSRLPAETQQILATASVVGGVFDVDLLGAVTGVGAGDVLDLLDPALVAGVLDETDLPGRFQFSHALVAETLEAEVSPARRARLHAATARALIELRAADIDSHLAEVAHHALAGAAAGTAQEAFDWSVRAARFAASRLAHEDAASHWARAVRALELARPADRTARYDALMELGRAHLRIDQVEEGYTALAAAIDLAIAMGDPDLVADAAAAMNIDGLWAAGELGLSGVDATGALARALEVIPDKPTPGLALALGALAENAYWTWSVPDLDALSARAVEVARATGDVLVLGRSLHKRNQTLWRAAALDQRAEAAHELLTLVESQPVPAELEALARFGAASVDYEIGEVSRALRNVRGAQVLARQIGSPALMTQLDFFESSIASFHGHLAEAEALAERGYELYRRTRRWIADALRRGIALPVLVEQLRLDELRSNRDELLDNDYRPWFKEGYAAALVQLGELDEAAEIAAEGIPPLVDCWLYLGMLGAALNVRVAIGDRAGADVLAATLAPYEGRLAATGTGTVFGDVHLVLARHSVMAGDDAEARRHIDASVEALAYAQAGPLLIEALLLRAEIAPQGAAADRARAATVAQRLDLPRSRGLVEAALR